MTRDVLILGATGRFGRAAATAFAQAGWHVRGHGHRDGDPTAAAAGAAVIVNAWNPPGYRGWASAVPRITAAGIAAAEASGATLIVPGNVYPFGRAPAPWSAATPHAPCTPKGRIRAQMEAALRAAAETGRIRAIVLRAGDFIDPQAAGTWPGEILKPVARGRLRWPGRADIDHAFAWLPDLGRAAVALAERRADLPAFADIAFPGHTLSGTDVAAIAGRVAGHPVTAGRLDWAPLRVAAPVWPLARGLVEMRYLWDHPHRLDGAAFRAAVPGFRATRAEDALAPLVRAAQGSATSTQTSRWSEARSAASAPGVPGAGQ